MTYFARRGLDGKNLQTGIGRPERCKVADLGKFGVAAVLVRRCRPCDGGVKS